KVRLDHLLSKDIAVMAIGMRILRFVLLYACLFSFEGAIASKLYFFCSCATVARRSILQLVARQHEVKL
ncbi:hypothetical protein DYI25_22275, partial [Mesobacillus boroniphilus]